MNLFISKLIRAGLSTTQAELYSFIYNNPDCSVADACLKLKQSKSSIYRAFDELKEKNLIEFSEDNWKQSMQVNTLKNLIQQLENRKRRDNYLINYFKSIELGKNLRINPNSDFIEVLNEEETFEKYLDLSEMAWDSMLAFGNWEDLNNENRNIVPVEKKFVRNRLKNGGKAFVSVTKEGPYTAEIIDYKNLDEEEKRKSTKSKMPLFKPFWANTFEGNDFVHLWNLGKKGELTSTFIHSPVVANFYRDLIYSNVV
jgi:hypothetical protein